MVVEETHHLGNTHIRRLNTKHQRDFVNHKVGPNNRYKWSEWGPLQMAKQKWVTGVKKTLVIGVIIACGFSCRQ